ncbi:MAG: AmmeMemoRadiSam system protein B, partial [Deltaproteobacteria bacterium]|nr:AmmeMemoRadiSam system protein B [Deltaproteobacteria bacterium]
YSGRVAGEAFGRVAIPRQVLLVGPNHRGGGHPLAVMGRGTWEMPLGAVPINESLAAALLRASSLFQEDPRPHADEHSLEVEVPFLQHRNPRVEIVPVTVAHLRLAACAEAGRAVAQVIREAPEPVLLVASTDLTHYEPHEQAMAKDALAIDRIRMLDPGGLLETAAAHDISMCGLYATALALEAWRALGAREAELVAYATSGDAGGDRASVVGYAGLVIR